MRYLAAFLICLFCLGCGGSGKSLNSGSEVDVNGDWEGTWKTIEKSTRMTLGTYQTVVTFAQTGSTIGGVIIVNGNETYPFIGTISGSSVSLEITLNDEKTVFSGTISEDSMTLMTEIEDLDELITIEKQ